MWQHRYDVIHVCLLFPFQIVSKFSEKTSTAKAVLQELRTYIEDENEANQNAGNTRQLRYCCGYDDNLHWNNLLQAKVCGKIIYCSLRCDMS